MSCVNVSCDEKEFARGLCEQHFKNLDGTFEGKLQLGDFCGKGHKIEGRNAQVYRGQYEEWLVRCRQCNNVGKHKRKMEIGDKCHRGHVVAGANLEYYTHSNGKRYFRCKECNLIMKAKRNEKYRTAPEFAEQRKRRSEREMARRAESLKRAERYDKILAMEVGQSSGSYTGLNYLKLGKRAQRVWEPLAAKFDSERGLCYKNPVAYIDYDEDDEPTRSQAYRLCDGCPLLVECGRFANAYKPAIGVWAGEVWKDGKVVGK